MKTIKYDGIEFKLYKNGRYYVNLDIKTRLHHYVFIKENGEIPKGYHVHHIDGDTGNNDISNLELIDSKSHLSHHAKKRIENNPEWFSEFHSKGIEKAKLWHSSDEGKKWHKKHYDDNKDKIRVLSSYICECCGSVFESENTNSRFCSNKCKSKYRRDSGIDNVTRICPVCEVEYETNKYRGSETCSRSCANKHRNRKD